MKTRHRKRLRNTRRRKLRGGVSADPSSSILPGPFSDMFNSLKFVIGQSNAALAGAYPGVDPSWVKQPLAANIM